METIGKLPTNIFSTLHGYSTLVIPNQIPHHWESPTQVDTHTKISNGFHTWAVEVRGDSVQWEFDERVVKTYTTSQLAPGSVWSFGYPMHMNLNLGVGGFFAGDPTPRTFFPEHLVVDWVRATALS
jgi:beta-glucanase (GH16 family)